MKWLPLFLMLCGIGPSQASQIATALEFMDEVGLRFLIGPRSR